MVIAFELGEPIKSLDPEDQYSAGTSTNYLMHTLLEPLLLKYNMDGTIIEDVRADEECEGPTEVVLRGSCVRHTKRVFLTNFQPRFRNLNATSAIPTRMQGWLQTRDARLVVTDKTSRVARCAIQSQATYLKLRQRSPRHLEHLRHDAPHIIRTYRRKDKRPQNRAVRLQAHAHGDGGLHWIDHRGRRLICNYFLPLPLPLHLIAIRRAPHIPAFPGVPSFFIPPSFFHWLPAWAFFLRMDFAAAEQAVAVDL